MSHLQRLKPAQNRVRISRVRPRARRGNADRFRQPWLLWLVLMSLAAAAAIAQETPEPKKKESAEDGKVYLLKSEKFWEQWIYYSAEESVKREENWEVITEKVEDQDEKILKCTGKPYGYLRSKEQIENCEIGLEWRYPKAEDGNSGVLVFIEGKDQIWPTSIQIQLHQPQAGRVFAMEGAKCEPAELPGKMLARPVNEWNSCKITCRAGTVSLVMNGQNMGEVKGCIPAKGFIALQSEGAEVHFRRIWKKPIK